MSKPISPSEVAAARRSSMPNEVIEAFNSLIAERWDGHAARVTVEEAVAAILLRMQAGGVQRSDVFAKHWLDVEELYRAEGWDVKFDKPAYNETYEANFTFRRAQRVKGRRGGVNSCAGDNDCG